MKKWQIENSETSEISEISEILFRVFLFPSFRFCPKAKIENLNLKILEKNIRDFRDFRVFDMPYIHSFYLYVQKKQNKTKQKKRKKCFLHNCHSVLLLIHCQIFHFKYKHPVLLSVIYCFQCFSFFFHLGACECA